MRISRFDENIAFLMGIDPLGIYTILFGMLILCGFGLPVPEDIILITGGYLAYEEYLNVHIMVFIGMIGVLLGDAVIFFLGRKFGKKLLKLGFIKRIFTEAKQEKASRYFHKYGNKIFFIARFLPGLRAPIYFMGGSLKAKFSVFFFNDLMAACISVPLWVYAAWYYGEYIRLVIRFGRRAPYLVAAIIILYIALKFGLRHYRTLKNKNPSKNKNPAAKNKNTVLQE